MASCATKKEIIYFQDVEALNLKEAASSFEPTIENNDILYITVSSLDGAVVKPFQRAAESGNANLANNNIELTGYLVNSTGSINFPVLGEVKVAGKTRGEIQQFLKEQLLQYVKDVVIDVRIINFKVTVLGEVEKPGVYTIRNERVTLPEAIGMAGDLTANGKRSEVTVIREENGQQKVATIDFTKSELFNSPFYFLKQNDVVYVTPTIQGVKKSGFIPDVPALLSLFTVVLTSVILLTN